MEVTSLYQQISQFHQWQRGIRRQLDGFAAWADQHKLASPELAHCLKRSRSLLAREDFTVAFVGEFSRGKTEIINALLFAEYGHRILPSTPGRTTMCPTEIYYDRKRQVNCVRLLPIETRCTTTSIASFKRIPEKWVTIEFDPHNPIQLEQAIEQVATTKQVTAEQARRLGFDAKHYRQADGTIEVPAWRHALISLNHPLLRHGLRILDTPGLNALGNEPELTLHSLPHAQAIVFILAADAGVTATDMTIWKEHIADLGKREDSQIITLLNKVDSMWDDLCRPEVIDERINKMRRDTAATLGMSVSDVIALSAKQGLLGKAISDQSRLGRSNFPMFEGTIIDALRVNQRRIAEHPMVADICTMLDNTRASLKERLFANDEELEQLEENTSPAAHRRVLASQRAEVKKTHARYHRQALSLRTSQRLLERQLKSLKAPVSENQLNQLIKSTQTQMIASWTSLGLARAIGDFFDVLISNITHLERESEQANRVLMSVYQREEHSNNRHLLERHLFQMRDFRLRLNQLTSRGLYFRRAINTLLSSKNTVISRFFNSLVREVRLLNAEMNRAIDDWTKEALGPLFQHNLYQKQLIEQHMLRLAEMANEQRDGEERLRQLRANIAQQENALYALDQLLHEFSGYSVTPTTTRDSKVISLDSVRRRA